MAVSATLTAWLIGLASSKPRSGGLWRSVTVRDRILPATVRVSPMQRAR